jgi:hypothetical protein
VLQFPTCNAANRVGTRVATSTIPAYDKTTATAMKKVSQQPVLQHFAVKAKEPRVLKGAVAA